MSTSSLAENLPYVTKEQMVEVDRAMMQDYKVDLLQMMENAGRNLAYLARARFFSGDVSGKHIVVLAGTGGNGGGALVCARRLQNYGASVSIYVTKSIRAFSPDAALQLNILGRMRVPITVSGIALPPSDVVLTIDGLIGYSLEGPPKGEAAKLIRWANEHNAPILALDMPSGMEATTGKIHDPTIKAAATMTLALPKSGFRAGGVKDHVGELYLADISVPPALYQRMGLQPPVGHIFNKSDILKLW